MDEEDEDEDEEGEVCWCADSSFWGFCAEGADGGEEGESMSMASLPWVVSADGGAVTPVLTALAGPGSKTCTAWPADRRKEC